jgi:hypothetical protein
VGSVLGVRLATQPGASVREAKHGVKSRRERRNDRSAKRDLVDDCAAGGREQHRPGTRVTAQLERGNTKLHKTIAEPSGPHEEGMTSTGVFRPGRHPA